MPKSILVGQIEEVIEKKGGAHLESYQLFDLYEGAQIKDQGFKSVAYSIVFRAKDTYAGRGRCNCGNEQDLERVWKHLELN